MLCTRHAAEGTMVRVCVSLGLASAILWGCNQSSGTRVGAGDSAQDVGEASSDTATEPAHHDDNADRDDRAPADDPTPGPEAPDLDVTDDTMNRSEGDDATERSHDVHQPDVGPEMNSDDVQQRAPITNPCSLDATPKSHTIILPLGETLHFSGDDYLGFWGVEGQCPVDLILAPPGSSAGVVGDKDATLGRFTADIPGTYIFQRHQDELIVSVDDAYLTADTFLNYNYSPSTPLVLESASRMWVASPVSNAVQSVNYVDGTWTTGALVPTGSWPTALAMWTDAAQRAWVLVAQTGRDTLGFLDPNTEQLTDAIRLGNEPSTIIVDGDVAYVVLSGADQVVKVDLNLRVVTARVDVVADPRAMVHDTERGVLYVSSLRSSNAHPQGPFQNDYPIPEGDHDLAVIDIESWSVSAWVPEIGTILRGLWLSDDNQTLLVSVSHARNNQFTVDADSRPHAHALVKIGLNGPQGPEVVGEVDLDLQDSSAGPAASPFTISLEPNGGRLFVTLSAGQGLLLLDPTSLEELGRWPAGSDPRGLVFTDDRVWTYAWLDNALVGWPLAETGDSIQLNIGADPTPLAVKQGQRMFNDAAFSAHGDFSCNNCHIDGLTDGLVWDLLLDGPVNTIAFRNIGGTAPFLWGGQLPTLFDFSREVLKLVGAQASGHQMGLVTTYMQSVTAPPNPYTLPGGKLTTSARRGQTLFYTPADEGGGGCGTCHGGPLLTNRSLVPGKSAGVMTDVPSLFGSYDTGPWGRLAQWTTLEAMVEYACDYTGADLTAEQRDDLVDYVKQQPADRLYVTGSRPLNEAHHIWFETPIEVIFSGVIGPSQVDHFSFTLVGATGMTTPVAGTWSLSGRVARFYPESPLELDSHYRITVAEDLRGTLGQLNRAGVEINFETGGLPQTDCSGGFDLELCEGSLGGCLKLPIALLQSEGGQVTGVVMDDNKQGTVDHLEGVVDGMVLSLDPFIVQSIIGPIYIEESVALEMVDQDGDGFADVGNGSLPLELLGSTYHVEFSAVRTSLPESF